MIAALARFVAALREAGLAVSPAAWIDAAQAARAVGVEDRGRLKSALRVTLVRRERELAVFERVFERVFAPPPRGEPGEGGSRGAGVAAGARPRQPPQAGSAGRRPPPPRPADTDEAREAPRSGAERLLERLGRARPGAARPPGRLRHVLLEPARRPGLAAHEPSAGVHPLERDLRGRASRGDELELARHVPRLIETLRLRSGRRTRAHRAGRLYLRGLFRENLRHGGVPFVLPRRARKPRRPRVLLLVDVSWSTARASACFLWLAGELLRLGRSTRVLLFVDRVVDATALLPNWLRHGPRLLGGLDASSGGRAGPTSPGAGLAPAGLAFDRWLDGIRGLDRTAASDYGRAFHALLGAAPRLGGRTTVLLVLGDGRTNRFAPLAWALDELAGRAAASIWLVPEPHEQWGQGDSALPLYLPCVDCVVETRDLAGLARGVAELLRRL